MSLDNDITAYLQLHADAKAKDIAAGLRVDKGDVNRALYKGRGITFQVDDNFKWSLLNGAMSSPSQMPDLEPAISNGVTVSRENILRARLTVARLKRGVPPSEGIDVLAVGMERLDRRLSTLLGDKSSARWFAVTGEYGEGKSFFRAFACQRALSAGYAVASLDVNKDEGALHQPQRHLSVLLRSLQSPLGPLRTQQGITDTFRQWISTTPAHEVAEVLKALKKVEPWSPAGNDPMHFRFLVDSALGTRDALCKKVRKTTMGPENRQRHWSIPLDLPTRGRRSPGSSTAGLWAVRIGKCLGRQTHGTS